MQFPSFYICKEKLETEKGGGEKKRKGRRSSVK